MPDDLEFRFDPAGSGWLRYGGLAVDEPLAVGAHGLTEAQRMQRALDILGNRQFLDRLFNSGTKGNFEQGPGPVPVPLPLASVVDKPWVIWRPTLENVVEWRQLANFIRAKVQSRIQNQTNAGKVKKIINDAIRDEIKRPTTDAGRKIHNAIKSETGVDPVDIFRPTARFKRLWTTRPGRQALFNAGVVVAGAIVSYAESATAATAQQQAQADLEAREAEMGRYATDHPEEGILIVQVFEIRQWKAESAAMTQYRYTTVSYDRKEHLALWKLQDQSSISMATDVFSTEYKEYIWIPPLNEGRDPIPVPPPQ